jgi:hypothetical protein
MKDIVNKIRIGDHVTDEELKDAIDHYKQLTQLLIVHGDRYHLVWRDANMELIALEGYSVSRKNKIIQKQVECINCGGDGKIFQIRGKYLPDMKECGDCNGTGNVIELQN